MDKEKINFISNQDLNITSGGWSGINYNIYEKLEAFYDINYIKCDPPSYFFEKGVSKAFRLSGLKGRFHFFSEKRLKAISREIKHSISDGGYNFYFGQTPWIKTDNDKPYGVYMDAAFPTYMDIYSDANKFSAADLLRIQKNEEEWLKSASHIFIGSEWAWQEMLKYYDIDESKKVVVHTGGNVPVPKKDNFRGGLNFLFISLDFIKKGGFMAVEVFQEIKKQYPDATLNIIGQKPPENVLDIEGINYHGILKKNNSQDLEKFIQILEQSFLIIHPTIQDTMGAVLIEAGYFGCPAIAPESFGIPEIVLSNKTGIVISSKMDLQSFTTPILELINNREKYFEMRENAFKHYHSKMTWENIVNEINTRIHECINC